MRLVYGREDAIVTDEHTLINMHTRAPESSRPHALPHARTCMRALRAGRAPRTGPETVPEAELWPLVRGSRGSRSEPGPGPSVNPSPGRVLSLRQDLRYHAGFPSSRLPAAYLASPKGCARESHSHPAPAAPHKVSSPTLLCHALSVTLRLFECSPPGPPDPANDRGPRLRTRLLLFLPAPAFPLLRPVPPGQQRPHGAALRVRVRGQGTR